jgi:cardiolipin synthase (CMP-forming)
MDPSPEPVRAEPTSRVLTVPNLVSALRIALIPVYVALVVDPDTTTVGVVLFAIVVATDWVDGAIARRTGQVSHVGTVLDPVADRLAIAAGLIAFAVRGLFPWWAATAILVRDGVILVVGAVALLRHGVQIEVRWIGKIATFSLMCAIAWIAWGSLDLPLGEAALVAGWIAFAVGIVESYVAALWYARDLAHAAAPA